MENKASITALMSAFGRAYHAENEPHPVFRDHLAHALMTDEEYKSVAGYILQGAPFFEPEAAPQPPHQLLRKLVNTHIAPSPLCRAAYTEQALCESGAAQYVILGAGLDTFAFREPDYLKNHRVFEVDHPLTQVDKRQRIARAGWSVPENLTFVPVDFTADRLSERLCAAGFDPAARSFFSWLGVTYYLPEEAIAQTLSELSALCAPGSTLMFDCPDENFFTARERRVQNTIRMAQAGGEPMRASFSPRRPKAAPGRSRLPTGGASDPGGHPSAHHRPHRHRPDRLGACELLPGCKILTRPRKNLALFYKIFPAPLPPLPFCVIIAPESLNRRNPP